MNTRSLSILCFLYFLPAVFCSFQCINLLSPWLIPKYFIYDAIVNKIIFFTSFSNCSLLLHRYAAKFCKLILYPINLMMIKDNNLAQFGTIKDRHGRDLTEAEDVKKRWQEYTENYTKKIFMTQITTML